MGGCSKPTKYYSSRFRCFALRWYSRPDLYTVGRAQGRSDAGMIEGLFLRAFSMSRLVIVIDFILL